MSWAVVMCRYRKNCAGGGCGEEGVLMGFGDELAVRMEEEGDTQYRAPFLIEHLGSCATS